MRATLWTASTAAVAAAAALAIVVAAVILSRGPVPRQARPSAAATAALPQPPATAAKPAAAATPVLAPPGFDTVSVAPDGQAVIAGRALPGDRVTVLDGGKPIGAVTADSRGEWVLLPDRKLAPGNRQLTLAATAPAGGRPRLSQEIVALTVAPPAATAAAVAAGAGPAASGSTYVVVRGNSLWRIAHQIYGNGQRYTKIYRANRERIHDPDLIFPGQHFAVPKS